jgi:transcriptional regulator of nitric oxide reductase
MFAHVHRRLFRSLIYALVAAQVFLSAPIASALGNGATAVTAEMPCTDPMPQSGDSKPCACCPDGTSSIAACLSACTASVGALPASAIQIVSTVVSLPPAAVFPPIADLAHPPLKPPPIA